MSAFLLTARARDDIESLVRRLAVAGPRTARRALDELFASMHWLAGEDGRGAPGDALDVGECVRLWLVRDVLLVWRPAREGDDAPAVLLRALRRVGASG